jgi:ribosomal peptide maturation radical SAM protein 1
MPWASVRRASVALAIIKQLVRAAGFVPEVQLLNIQFAEQLGLHLYESISQSSYHVEWYFAQYLFGAKGLKEIQNDWSDIRANPAAKHLIKLLEDGGGGSEALCSRIANIEVPKFIENCMEKVDWSKYVAIGFTTTFAQSLATLTLAKRIKENFPKVKIILGGANVDAEMGLEFIRGFPWVDYVVHGEAEHSFPALLKQIADGRDDARVPGVSMRRSDCVIAGHADAIPLADMNESPIPDYSDYLQAIVSSGLSNKFQMELYFESSRGCWWGTKHHCTFCGLNGSAMAYRKKNADRVYSEIIQLSKRYRCLRINSVDNILAMDYFKDLLPRLAGQDIDLDLFYEVKTNLNRGQVELLRAAGVKRIQPGIESFNSRLLKLMQKGTTAIQNAQLLKWCHEIDIQPTWNLLYGFPGETAEDYTDLPQLFRLLFHLSPPECLGPVSFERFSPYFFDRDKYGLELKPWSGYQFIFPERRVSLDKIAYVFEGKLDHAVDTEGYIQPVREAWNVWRTLWKEQRVFCYYEKGVDYLLINDNRPKAINAPLIHRRLRLEEPIATIYLYCDQYHSFQAICKMFEDKFPGSAGRDTIQAWLCQLVAEGLMFREGDQYLSLAIHKKKQAQ